MPVSAALLRCGTNRRRGGPRSRPSTRARSRHRRPRSLIQVRAPSEIALEPDFTPTQMNSGQDDGRVYDISSVEVTNYMDTVEVSYDPKANGGAGGNVKWTRA